MKQKKYLLINTSEFPLMPGIDIHLTLSYGSEEFEKAFLGISPLKEKGALNLDFSEEGRYLVCAFGNNQDHDVATICSMIRREKAGQGMYKILIRVHQRFKIQDYVSEKGVAFCVGEVVVSQTTDIRTLQAKMKLIVEALNLKNKSSQYDLYFLDQSFADPKTFHDLENFLDALVAISSIPSDVKQKILQEIEIEKRCDLFLEYLSITDAATTLFGSIKEYWKQFTNSLVQKFVHNFYKEHRSKEKDSLPSDEDFLKNSAVPEKTKEVFRMLRQDLSLHQGGQQSGSQEYAMKLQRMNRIKALPYGKYSPLEGDIHYYMNRAKMAFQGVPGETLDHVKCNILTHLAQIVRGIQAGRHLLLVGPPGNGKTTFIKLIGTILNRKVSILNMNGKTDASILLGNKSIYVNSEPGWLANEAIKNQCMDFVVGLDELEKTGFSHRPKEHSQDVVNTLLHILDPIQNKEVVDEYLGVPMDCSSLIFVCTANFITDSIAGPLSDRLEIIDIPQYSPEDKELIFPKLLSKILSEQGLKEKDVAFEQDICQRMIRLISETGIRTLERIIRNTIRNIVFLNCTKKIKFPITVTADNFHEFVPILTKYTVNKGFQQDTLGGVNGLSVSLPNYIGSIAPIELIQIPGLGKGKVTITGNVQRVMQESVEVASLRAFRKSADENINPETFLKKNFAFHAPAGGTPKDGPSVGLAAYVAFRSIISGYKVRWNVAMTGEIRLQGDVLPVGGIREKLLSAREAGKTKILISKANEENLEKLPENFFKDVTVVLISDPEEALVHALAGYEADHPDQSGGEIYTLKVKKATFIDTILKELNPKGVLKGSYASQKRTSNSGKNVSRPAKNFKNPGKKSKVLGESAL